MEIQGFSMFRIARLTLENAGEIPMVLFLTNPVQIAVCTRYYREWQIRASKKTK
jgi:hypothetical protein